MPFIKTLRGDFFIRRKSHLFRRRKAVSFDSDKSLFRAFRSKGAILALVLAGFLSSIEAGPVAKVRNPRLRSAAFVVQDQNTDEFLLSKKPEAVMPIASITKLMTAMDFYLQPQSI